jgi:hypothetical protein
MSMENGEFNPFEIFRQTETFLKNCAEIIGKSKLRLMCAGAAMLADEEART